MNPRTELYAWRTALTVLILAGVLMLSLWD